MDSDGDGTGDAGWLGCRWRESEKTEKDGTGRRERREVVVVVVRERRVKPARNPEIPESSALTEPSLDCGGWKEWKRG